MRTRDAVLLSVLSVMTLVSSCHSEPAIGPFAHDHACPLSYTGTPLPAAFPLRVADNHRYLVDRTGRPFLIQGDSPWDIIVTPTWTDALAYMDNRRSKGVNTLLVELIEHKGWPNVPVHAPNTTSGLPPFLRPCDFATPNDAYFAYAHDILTAARDRGFLVLLTPAYMGYSGLEEGWWDEMDRSNTESCASYGRYVAAHFGDLENIIWVHGGDRLPPPGSTGEACGLAIMRPLLDIPGSLHTAHWNKGTADNGSLDEAAFAPFMQVDSAYTYGLSYPLCARERGKTSLPTFLIETQYEGEHHTRGFELRRQSYWAALTCGAGQVFGNLPLWSFATGWRDQLESDGAHDMVRLYELLSTRRWYDLVPDTQHRVVTRGYGRWGAADYVTAGATDDGQLAIAYVPSTGTMPRTMDVDLGALRSPVTARWYNPTRGAFLPAASYPLGKTGPVSFTTPGDNGTEQNDWALVLEGRR
jgi:hypothetical protein